MIAILLIMLLSSVAQGATTHYVSPNGNDSEPCGSTKPRKTLKRASECVKPGDTLVVHGGVYNNECLGDFTNEWVSPIPSGSEAQPTIVKNAPGETVWLRHTGECATGGGGALSFAQPATHDIIIEGINCNGVDGHGHCIDLGGYRMTYRKLIAQHGSECMQGDPKHSTFEDITVRYCGYNEQMQNVCWAPELGCHGIYTKDNYNTFRRIVAHDNDGIGLTVVSEGSGYHNTIEDSVFYRNGGGGVVGYSGNLVKNSLFYENYVGVIGGIDILNCTIVNNNMANPGSGQPANLGVRADGNQRIQNTIVVGHALDISTGGGNYTFANNIVGTPASMLFLDPSNRDYHLRPGSPAINAGMDLAEIPMDMEGNQRNSPTDVGSYEFAATAPAVASYVIFHKGPSNAKTGVGIDPPVVVHVTDAQLRLVPSSNATITLEMASNSAGAELSGPTTRDAIGGVATFYNLVVNKPCAGCKILTKSTGLGGDTSNTFSVTGAPVVPSGPLPGQCTLYMPDPKTTVTTCKLP